MSDLISKVCSLPRDFYQLNDKSIEQLFSETGYLEEMDTVTKEKLVTYLTENPSLISYWEMYSSDKRYSPAWYFQRIENNWIVGYSSTSSQEHQLVFQSEFEACAEFILQELRHFTENRER